MTVLVGVRCTDGVVVGADSMATSSFARGGLTGLPMDKICIVGGKAIIAGTGAVGLGQRFEEVVSNHVGKKTFTSSSVISAAAEVCRDAINNFGATGAVNMQQQTVNYGAILAVLSENAGQLIEFEYGSFQPEVKRDKLFFVAMGSGQQLAEPFVAFVSRVLWKDQPPDIKTAKFGVLWALEHCIKYAPGGVGEPISIAVLEKRGSDWRAELLTDADFAEQRQHIEAIEAKIREYPAMLLNQAAATPLPDASKIKAT